MDKLVFPMSSAGKCPRALSAAHLDYEAEATPNWLEGMAEEGRWHERRIINELTSKGWQVERETPCQKCLTEREVERDGIHLEIETHVIILIGHGEAKITPVTEAALEYLPEDMRNMVSVGETILLEIKSMSQFEFDRWMRGAFDAFPNYLAQITCYFEASGLGKCLYLVRNRNSGYTDFRIIQPIKGYSNAIIQSLEEIALSVDEGKLFPAEYDMSSIECRRCSYKNICIPEPSVPDKATEKDLMKATENIRLGNKLLEEGDNLVKSAKRLLYNHSKATNQTKWQWNKMALQIIFVKEQTTYPKANLLNKYGEEELADIAKIKEPYEYLSVTDLAKEER